MMMLSLLINIWSIRRKLAATFTVIIFVFNAFVSPVGIVNAQEALGLPVAGSMLNLSPVFAPPLLKGIKVYRNDPFRFDFILDKGDSTETDDQLKTDSNRLIKYFLASLTVPEKDLWVNLSPYEKNRIVPEAFGQTEMGRDLLAQDYILKQITASVIYPEGEVGKQFWAKVHAEAQKRYGTADVPVDTFNKVWIVPEKATVIENKDAAFVAESKLKVMLEEDYLALEKNSTKEQTTPATHKLGSDVVREVVIPILEKEVNEGKNFAPLRQVYHSLILATWYKRKVRESILGRAYVDKQKTAGIDIVDKNEKEKIWQQYVEAFKKGAYNFIKEEYDPATQMTTPRKYFSGGEVLARIGRVFKVEEAGLQHHLPSILPERALVVQTRTDPAMNHEEVATTLADSTILPSKKGEVLANLIQRDASIRKGLNQSRERITDFDLNTQYFVTVDDVDVSVSISFVLKELHIIGRERKFYTFFGAGVEDSGRLSLEDFLKVKLDVAKGAQPVTMEAVLRDEGLLRYFEHGLPIERGGALLFNSRTKSINVHEYTANAVYSVAQVEFDKTGRLLSTGINGDSMWEMPQESYEIKVLGFHFHPEEVLQPSVADAEIIIRKNRPELIIGPSGRGAIWFVKDLEEGRRISKSPHFQRLGILSLSTQKDVLLRFLDFVEVDLNNPAQGAVSPNTSASFEQTDWTRKDGAKNNAMVDWQALQSLHSLQAERFTQALSGDVEARVGDVIDKLVHEAGDELSRRFPDGSTILVAGFGKNWQEVKAFAERFPQCKIVGVDWLQNNIDLAKANLDGEQWKNVSVVAGNVADLSLENVRMVYASYLLDIKLFERYANDPEAEKAVRMLFNALYRQLMPGGYFVSLPANPITVGELQKEQAGILLNEGSGLKTVLIAKKADSAMLQSAVNGGIDFNPNKIDLKTKNNGGEIKFNIDPAMLQRVQNAPGVIPVVIDVCPMTMTVPVFLGLGDSVEKVMPVR